jgi:hypothetical protein
MSKKKKGEKRSVGRPRHVGTRYEPVRSRRKHCSVLTRSRPAGANVLGKIWSLRATYTFPCTGYSSRKWPNLTDIKKPLVAS